MLGLFLPLNLRVNESRNGQCKRDRRDLKGGEGKREQRDTCDMKANGEGIWRGENPARGVQKDGRGQGRRGANKNKA